LFKEFITYSPYRPYPAGVPVIIAEGLAYILDMGIDGTLIAFEIAARGGMQYARTAEYPAWFPHEESQYVELDGCQTKGHAAGVDSAFHRIQIKSTLMEHSLSRDGWTRL